MAHVLLPCDLPNWVSVQKYLDQVGNCKSIAELIPLMKKLHDICSISLDPDEMAATKDGGIFDGLRDYLLKTMSTRELGIFFEHTLKDMVKHALNLQNIRPLSGLQYCLQQHGKCVNDKCSNISQHNKLSKILEYFNSIINQELKGSIRFCRRVDNNPCTVFEWLESRIPLCEVTTTRTKPWNFSKLNKTYLCTSRSLLSGAVLVKSENTVAEILLNNPEILPFLLFMETVTENEVITVHKFEFSSSCPEVSPPVPPKASYILIGSKNDISDDSQFSEETVLNELNNLCLGFSEPWLYKGSRETRVVSKSNFIVEVIKPIEENVINSDIVTHDRLEKSKPITFPAKFSQDNIGMVSSDGQNKVPIPITNRCDQDVSTGEKQKMDMIFSALDPRKKVNNDSDSSDECATENNSGKKIN
ncbi:hypothetical protein GQR58_018917 [Nymphon striatum]|nr:hypothetical protein GQR58_018917 [Nymphon striatum]